MSLCLGPLDSNKNHEVTNNLCKLFMKCQIIFPKKREKSNHQSRRFAAIQRATHSEYKINYIRTFRVALVPIKRHSKKYERCPLNTGWGEARKLSYICSDAVNVGREYFSISLESVFFLFSETHLVKRGALCRTERANRGFPIDRFDFSDCCIRFLLTVIWLFLIFCFYFLFLNK